MPKGAKKTEKFKATILSRDNPLDNPWGEPNKAWPEHDQESPLVSITFGLTPLTQEIIDLYKMDEENERKLDLINLDENLNAGNRKNFAGFKEMNYKKFFYKQTRSTNTKFQDQIKFILEKEMKAQAKEIEDNTGKKLLFIKQQDWIDRVGHRFQ